MPAPTHRPPVPRRTLLRAALGGAGMATTLTACTAPTPSPAAAADTEQWLSQVGLLDR